MNIELNSIVTVTVDRALGSVHPKYNDLIYPINYGYIKGIMANDGEYQDAYIVGVSEPVSTFTGVVIAVIRRKNDVEDKLVVAPTDMRFTKKEIEQLTLFQEKYFETQIIMSNEK